MPGRERRRGVRRGRDGGLCPGWGSRGVMRMRRRSGNPGVPPSTGGPSRGCGTCGTDPRSHRGSAQQSGEGVFGLRRAFTQAGAKNLVMSLWAVPDRETQELMVAFYTNMLSGTLNRAQALRQAALAKMQVVKTRHGDAHPFFWGAFVFLGEP